MVWKRRCAVVALWLGALLCAAGADAAPVRIYSEDWSGGQGAWGGIGGFRWPRRMFVGHPLAQYAYYFGGSCGMGLRANTIPSVRLRNSTISACPASARAWIGDRAGTYHTIGRVRYSGCSGKAIFQSMAIL